MAFVRILPMNLLFCGLFRAFFRGAGRGGVRLLVLRGGADGAGSRGALAAAAVKPDRNDRKKEGAAEMPLLLRYGGNFPVGERRPCGPNRRPARTVKSGFSPSAPALAEKVL